MAQAYLSIGSNIDPQNNVLKALRMLAQKTNVRRVSSFYLTRPVGVETADRFVNGAVCVHTSLSPLDLRDDVIRPMELELGRDHRNDKSLSRTIDIDIILYDDLVMNTPDMKVPSDDLRKYPFVAWTICEIAPDIIVPDNKQRLSSLAGSMPRDDMQKLDDFTRAAHKELFGEDS